MGRCGSLERCVRLYVAVASAVCDDRLRRLYTVRSDRPLLPPRDEQDLVGGGQARTLARRGIGGARCWAEIGSVPAEDVAAIRAHAVTPTAERVAEIEQTTDHDLAAFVDAVAEQLGPEGRWVHYGLTSSDVVDTALALQMRDAGELVLRASTARSLRSFGGRKNIGGRCASAARTASTPSDDVRVEARRLGIRARSRRSRLRARARAVRVGQLSGTVGTYAAIDPEVERIACERLGLEPDPVSTQVIARDRHAELLSALALCATSLDRFARRSGHLARTEVREVEEPFATGMKGSSAMPHKRNPKVAERISGLARVVRAAAVVGLEKCRSGTSATFRTRPPSAW